MQPEVAAGAKAAAQAAGLLPAAKRQRAAPSRKRTASSAPGTQQVLLQVPIVPCRCSPALNICPVKWLGGNQVCLQLHRIWLQAVITSPAANTVKQAARPGTKPAAGGRSGCTAPAQRGAASKEGPAHGR